MASWRAPLEGVFPRPRDEWRGVGRWHQRRERLIILSVLSLLSELSELSGRGRLSRLERQNGGLCFCTPSDLLSAICYRREAATCPSGCQLRW
jgi:hypothetical protein